MQGKRETYYLLRREFDMDQRLQPLFTPWKIGNCEIKNRVVLTSMGGTNLLGWMEINYGVIR